MTPGASRSARALLVWSVGAAAGCAPEAGTPAPEPAARASAALCAGRAAYAPGDVVERVDSAGGAFTVHFTRTAGSPHAVDPTDADGDGTPDRVSLVADTFDDALAHYAALGWRAPLPDDALACDDGGPRLDVYVRELGLVNGFFRKEGCVGPPPRACTGYFELDQDLALAGYPTPALAVAAVASHELFHAVQASYDAFRDAVLEEATAVWASDGFVPEAEELTRFAPGYLAEPDRGLDQPGSGPIQGFPYGAALFFRFLELRHGPDLVEAVWEAAATSEAHWIVLLDGALAARDDGYLAAFRDFARANLFTGPHATPARSYPEAADYPAVATARPGALPFADPDRLGAEDDVGLPGLARHATRYVAFDPAGRDAITAAVRVPPGRPTSLDGLELFLATRGPGDDRLVTLVDPAAGVETLTVGGAEAVVLGVSHAWLDADAAPAQGPSRVPALCVGTVEEVQACLAAFDPSLRDAGPPPGGDAGPPVGDGGGGCACAVEPPSRAGGLAPALLALALVLSARRRRTRAAPAPPSAPGRPPRRW